MVIISLYNSRTGKYFQVVIDKKSYKDIKTLWENSDEWMETPSTPKLNPQERFDNDDDLEKFKL